MKVLHNQQRAAAPPDFNFTVMEKSITGFRQKWEADARHCEITQLYSAKEVSQYGATTLSIASIISDSSAL
jgi:hypothetical protein